MRPLGMFLLTISVLFYAIALTFLRPYHAMKPKDLEAEHEELRVELTERDANMTLPVGGVERLSEMRRDRTGMQWELWRRSAAADLWMPALAIVGLFLTIGAGARRRAPRKAAKELQISSEIEVSVPEATPREEYVDEWEYRRRSEGGFRSREEAVEFLYRDPLLKCDYCGAKLRPTFGSEREALELVTFYKQVPPGAKDLRIVLGSLWFAKAASELKCTGCERVVRR